MIPAQPVGTEPTPLDRDPYRSRNRVARPVNKLGRFQAVATRYAKTTQSFLALAHLAAPRLWLRCVHTA